MTVHTPIESRTRGVPRWALGLTGVTFLAGAIFLATNLGGENPPITGESHPPNGGPDALAVIERVGCQACHGPDLSGQASFPSLHGVKDGPVSENLQQLAADHPEDWANLWIAGTDPAVADLERLGMPVFAGPPNNLTAEEIAAVVDYLKTLP